ncbi:DUF3857 domain-containing transglutaminase family protein [Winogradskyella litorisediminis]|uniref:DUF3857 domain-containing transglutaminase family protein n=1 Tax=Winogradskyella litorisediminis TaxID=1156618 RepID=A0ABW3N5M4_9FLAO
MQNKPTFLKLKSFLFLILISSSLIAQIQKRNTPNWVDIQSYEKAPDIDGDDISFGLLTLLSDEQIHAPKQERYLRTVSKITDNVGVQSGSLISINYDPTYQKLYLHKILVIRDDKVIDKLNLNDFQTIRKESNSENYIYDGSVNATANLSDIRTGDIVDYSYTIVGFNPIDKKFSGMFLLSAYVPIGKINVSILNDSDLNIKLINSEIQSKISSEFGLKKYNWTNTNTTAPEFEENTASWHMHYENLFVSEYDTWNQVVDWAIPIYEKEQQLSKELKTKIASIKNASEYEKDRIKLALKFVQNDIRYLGLESGIGAYKPFKPNKVFEQRFGDCKDKSWLLVNMLREMDIEAYPVLINTTYGKTLGNFLPSPKAFDHVIVKVIDSTKTGRFFDPTITNQEGSFNTIATPNYKNGLVLKQGNSSFEAIQNDDQDLVEIFDIFNVNGIGNDMTLNVTTVYRGSEADMMRGVLKSNSLTSLNKDYRDYYKNLYGEVEIIEAMIFEDDTLSNKITIEESYRLDKVWEPVIGDDNQIGLNFMPYSFYNNIVFPTEKNRKTPFSLYYPIHKKHKVTIKLPMSWGFTPDSKQINNEHFKFSYKSKANRRKDILYLDYEYINKKDAVAPEDFLQFYNDCKAVEENFSMYLFIPKSAAKMSSLFSNKKTKVTPKISNTSETKSQSDTVNIIFLVLIGFGIVGLVSYVIKNNRKYK